MKFKYVLLVLTLIAVVFVSGCQAADKPEVAGGVQEGDAVRIHYTGKLDDGTVFDSSEGRDPLQFIVGDGQVISGFEEAVIGMEPGESKTVKIPADKAYGPYDKEKVGVIDRSQFPADTELEVGQQLTVRPPSGEMITATVIDVSETSVTVDANHHLAGKDLTFEIELVEIL